ncbi:MAG: type II secretion system major pseudopilin GspG [Pirellulales bacterium]
MGRKSIQIRRARVQRQRAGFTLMEVLLVLMILVVLASMAVTIFSGTQEQALKDAAKGQLGVFKTAISTYQIHTRKLPSDLKELVDKPADSKIADRWNGPYIDREAVDPWDNPYKIAVPGKHNPDSYDVWSTGPDGQDGTADDIGNWE